MIKNFKEKLIIDTDPGQDDAMAILLMLASSKYEIVAITTVAGNSILKNTTRNARYILSLANRLDIPIFAGASKPLKRNLITADIHGQSGLDGSESEKIKIGPLISNASKKIGQIIWENPGKVTILALGPLTNIARAFIKDPFLAKKVKNLIIMGGAISVPGNKSRVAEFNFFVDPEAAKSVLSSDAKKVLVPLDACNDILMSQKEIDLMGKGKIAKSLQRMLKPYVKKIAKFEGVKGAFMYDPLATYYLLNPSAFKSSLMDVVVETKGEYTAGMSVAEKRIVADKNNNTEVATKIDGKKFLEDFVKAIKLLDEEGKNE